MKGHSRQFARRFVPLLLPRLAVALLVLSPAVSRASEGPPASVETAVAPASVALPPELDRVLRDYEREWGEKDAAGLAALFADDGYVLSNGRPPVAGRVAIAKHYEGHGGPLFLRAFHFRVEGGTGYILGGYAGAPAGMDDGKFTLTLRRGSDGRWLIVSDMDNGNLPPRPAEN